MHAQADTIYMVCVSVCVCVCPLQEPTPSPTAEPTPVSQSGTLLQTCPMHACLVHAFLQADAGCLVSMSNAWPHVYISVHTIAMLMCVSAAGADAQSNTEPYGSAHAGELMLHIPGVWLVGNVLILSLLCLHREPSCARCEKSVTFDQLPPEVHCRHGDI